MKILGRELRVIDITPFREDKCYRIEVYQRDYEEYCDKLNSHGKEQCDGSCKGLFLTTEAYRGRDSIYISKDATMMVIPSHGFVNEGTFVLGFGLPNFDLFEDFLKKWQNKPYLQRNLELETEQAGSVTFYTAKGVKFGWRKNACSMENKFRFVDEVLPENLDVRRFGFLYEADETLAFIRNNRTELDANKKDMSHDEKLAEAAAIAETPGGWEFLYDRFDLPFIKDVESFVQHAQKK